MAPQGSGMHRRGLLLGGPPSKSDSWSSVKGAPNEVRSANGFTSSMVPGSQVALFHRYC